jgi:hypothetical protein
MDEGRHRVAVGRSARVPCTAVAVVLLAAACGGGSGQEPDVQVLGEVIEATATPSGASPPVPGVVPTTVADVAPTTPAGPAASVVTARQDDQFTVVSELRVTPQVVAPGETVRVHGEQSSTGPNILNLYDAAGQRTTRWEEVCEDVDLVTAGATVPAPTTVWLTPTVRAAEPLTRLFGTPRAAPAVPAPATPTPAELPPSHEYVGECLGQRAWTFTLDVQVPDTLAAGEYRVNPDFYPVSHWNEASRDGTYHFTWVHGDVPTILVEAG